MIEDCKIKTNRNCLNSERFWRYFNLLICATIRVISIFVKKTNK